jgi:hypothetical protein
MSKPHGHYCRSCRQYKANEKFSGRGHAAHICKECAKRGNKPPDVKPDPLQFIDEDSLLFESVEYEPPKPKKKRKPGKEKLIRASQEQQAKGFLTRILADSDVSVVKIHEAASKAGLPKEALHRAKGSLGVIAVAAENGAVWRFPKAKSEQMEPLTALAEKETVIK